MLFAIPIKCHSGFLDLSFKAFTAGIQRFSANHSFSALSLAQKLFRMSGNLLKILISCIHLPNFIQEYTKHNKFFDYFNQLLFCDPSIFSSSCTRF